MIKCSRRINSGNIFFRKKMKRKKLFYYVIFIGTAIVSALFFYHDRSVKSSLLEKYADSEAAVRLLKDTRAFRLYQKAHEKEPLISPIALSLALEDLKKSGKEDANFDYIVSLAGIRVLLGAFYPTDFALSLSETANILPEIKPQGYDAGFSEKNEGKEFINEIMTLALQAYFPPDQAGNKKYRVTDYASAPNGFSATAFQDEEKHIIIAFRGADEAKDMDELKRMLDGKKPLQFENADAFYKKLRKNHPDALIRVTGHSLGGSLAQLLAVYHDDVSALTCNPVGTKRLIQKDFNADNIFNLIVRNDVFPLAMPQAGHSVVIPPENTDKYGDPLHPHSVLQCFFK